MDGVKVKDHPGLIKSPGYVVNTDSDAYTKALARIQSSKKIKTLQQRVEGLESNVAKLMEQNERMMSILLKS